MKVMSQEQKEQLAWITRIITMCLLGIASMVGVSVYNKVDEMYAINKVYYEKILQLEQRNIDTKEAMRDMRVELKELREINFRLQSRLNINLQ